MKTVLLCLVLLVSSSSMSRASTSTADYKSCKKICIPMTCIVMLVTFIIARLAPSKDCIDTKTRLKMMLEENTTHDHFAVEIERLTLAEADKIAILRALEAITNHADEYDATLAMLDSEPLKEIIQASTQQRRQSRAAFFGPKHERRHLRKR